MNRREFLKTGTLTAAAIGAAPALMSCTPNQDSPWIPKGGYTIAELNTKVEEYFKSKPALLSEYKYIIKYLHFFKELDAQPDFIHSKYFFHNLTSNLIL